MELESQSSDEYQIAPILTRQPGWYPAAFTSVSGQTDRMQGQCPLHSLSRGNSSVVAISKALAPHPSGSDAS